MKNPSGSHQLKFIVGYKIQWNDLLIISSYIKLKDDSNKKMYCLICMERTFKIYNLVIDFFISCTFLEIFRLKVMSTDRASAILNFKSMHFTSQVGSRKFLS